MAVSFMEALDQLESISQRLKDAGDPDRPTAVMNEEVTTLERGLKGAIVNRGNHVVTTRREQTTASVRAKGPMIPFLRPVLIRQRDAGQERINEAIQTQLEEAR